jgi:DNA-binding MarR family transcriptional regulator
MKKSKWMFLHTVLDGAESFVPVFDSLNPLDRKVFREVLSFDRLDQPLTVKELISSGIDTPAALRKSLAHLLEAKLIKVEADPEDKKLLYLVQTAKSEKVLDQLAKGMEKMAVGARRLAEMEKKAKASRKQ